MHAFEMDFINFKKFNFYSGIKLQKRDNVDKAVIKIASAKALVHDFVYKPIFKEYNYLLELYNELKSNIELTNNKDLMDDLEKIGLSENNIHESIAPVMFNATLIRCKKVPIVIQPNILKQDLLLKLGMTYIPRYTIFSSCSNKLSLIKHAKVRGLNYKNEINVPLKYINLYLLQPGESAFITKKPYASNNESSYERIEIFWDGKTLQVTKQEFSNLTDDIIRDVDIHYIEVESLNKIAHDEYFNKSKYLNMLINKYINDTACA